MKNKKRRQFLQTLSTGIAGSIVLPSRTIRNAAKTLADRQADNSEDFWEFVKAQFLFAPKLRYFNNASLGASPLMVQQATKTFRDTLDAFPFQIHVGRLESGNRTN